MPSYVKIKRSKIPNAVPNVNQIDTETLVYNEIDGRWYSKRILADLTEEIIFVGGGAPPPGESHARAHQINSADDHPAVAEPDRNKLVATNAETGQIEFVSKYQTISEILTGAVDGVNRVFSTSSAFMAGKIEVYVNGLREIYFTESSDTTITLDEAPKNTGFTDIIASTYTLKT